MQDNEPTTAITVRVSAATHRVLLRQAQQEHRSLAGQAAYLPERVRRALAAERAEHWAQQARGLGGLGGLGGDGPEGRRTGAEGDERAPARRDAPRRLRPGRGPSRHGARTGGARRGARLPGAGARRSGGPGGHRTRA
jgi:hypothetical protein